MDQKMEQVDIFLYLHPKRIGKIKEGTYKYTLSCRGQQITGEEKTRETTEYRLALLCLISALQRMRRPSLLTIHTDCRYLQNGHQSIPAWKENGWTRAGNQELRNADLWKQVDKLFMGHAVRFKIEKMD